MKGREITGPSKNERSRTVTESVWIRAALTGVMLLFICLFLVVPLAAVFVQSFEKGMTAYFAAVREAESLAAVRLTLIVAAFVVPINLLFGIAAAWAIAKFRFPGKNVLITFIDMPFAVSPVIAGLTFVLLLGLHGALGPWLLSHGIKIIFAVPGIVIATLFITAPFIARELIPLMQGQGSDEEEAARVLGAGGWRTFCRVTLPNIKWGLMYGVILCSARTIGEFGAVSVVSGHIRGNTLTLPLQVEILYNEYRFTAAFAVASLLTLMALAALGAKSFIEWKYRSEQ